MKGYLLPILILLLFFNQQRAAENSYQVTYRISKPYCLLNFMEMLRTGGYYGPSLHNYFKKSKYADDEELKQLVDRYKRVKVKYSYEFKGYPKYRYMTNSRSTRDLFYMMSAKSETLEEYKLLTLGLVPYYVHEELFDIFKAVEPIYDELIWNPYIETARNRLGDLISYSEEIEFGKTLNSITNLFDTHWKRDMPVIVCFAIVPGDKIKLIPPPQGNVVFCNLLTESENYSDYLGKVAHEFAHRTFAEQSLETHKKIDGWLNNSSSPYRFMVNLMFNEVIGGAVGHKVMTDMIGEHDFTYGQQSVKNFNEGIYSLVEFYMTEGRQIDSNFAEKSLKIYGNVFPNAFNEYNYLLQTYYLVSDADNNLINKLPALIAQNIAKPMMYETGTSLQDDNTISEMINYDFAKLLVITKDHAETFNYLRTRISKVNDYNQLNYNSDFILSFHDGSGKAYIIMNLHQIDLFENALKKLSEAKTINTGEPVIEL